MKSVDVYANSIPPMFLPERLWDLGELLLQSGRQTFIFFTWTLLIYIGQEAVLKFQIFIRFKCQN